jgi:uncharacterized protein (DUF169 family)
VLRRRSVEDGTMTNDPNSSQQAADFASLARSLSGTLHLAVPPIAISFEPAAPSGIPEFDEPMSEPTDDGRSGRVPAGCVFWVRATERAFTTLPEDHGNCSVGRYTHGLASLEEISTNSDVATLVESGWVDPSAFSGIPAVSQRPGAITYGPLSQAVESPDVVLVRVNGRQLMVLSDAVPGMRIEGKPQCHIVALAKEQGEVAASVGCALSRARTGMHPEEMTVAIPGSRLGEVVESVEHTAGVDNVVARYAAEDARRFASASGSNSGS